jgi:hypothetical protein
MAEMLKGFNPNDACPLNGVKKYGDPVLPRRIEKVKRNGNYCWSEYQTQLDYSHHILDCYKKPILLGGSKRLRFCILFQGNARVVFRPKIVEC